MVNIAIPTPSPLPSPSDSPYSLSERINIATRPTHSKLNKLILARLPLAVPPYAANPSTYISGLLYLTPLYVTFESLWQSTINAPNLPTSLAHSLDTCGSDSRNPDSKRTLFDACGPEIPVLESKCIHRIPSSDLPPSLVHAPKVCSRTKSLLAHLRLPGLLRAGRLRADIRVLTCTPEHKIEEQLGEVSKNVKLVDFIAHIKQSAEASPHVLLSYAWVLYMVLFSGGSYLRASLNEAGGTTEFWGRPYSDTSQGRRNSKPDPICPTTTQKSCTRTHSVPWSENVLAKIIPGLQFFNFAGDEDGEDIKLEFKKRITEAEILLTPGEKEDIIAEAQHIFTFMVEMVGELDRVMGTSDEDLETARIFQDPAFIGTRDSVTITRERLLRRRITLEEEEENVRKMSYLEALFTSPVTRIIQFSDATLKAMVTPLRRNFSKRLDRQVSFGSEMDKQNLGTLEGAGLQILATFLPVSALVVAFVVWYFMARWVETGWTCEI